MTVEVSQPLLKKSSQKLKLYDCPYYDIVPRDLHDNLKYRREILNLTRTDLEARKNIWIMCSRDILFYTNTFVWTVDPRIQAGPSERPFITYKEFQDEAITEIIKGIVEGFDIGNEKSRDMGASWCGLIAIKWMWHFHTMSHFLLGSRKEEYVDKTGDHKCLFWKIDYMLKREPEWLKPLYTRTKLHLLNDDNGSTIEGESTTGDFARGDRRTAIFLDEFAAVDQGFSVLAATADVTRCRIFNSTYEGTGNAFYEVMQWESVKKLSFHWSKHPEKAKGLYRVNNNGSVEILDIEWHEKNPGYNFSDQPGFYQGLRSPWYDKERLRRTENEAKEQLDMDPMGRSATFFQYDDLRGHEERNVRKPFETGFVEYDPDTFEFKRFVKNEKGIIKIWCLLDSFGNPKKHTDYCAGVDISAGTGASNSVMSIGDKQTNEKVLELVTPNYKPTDFANLCYVVLSWFKSEFGLPYLIWEANSGLGRNFKDRILALNYTRIYYKKNEISITKKVTDQPGWFSSRDAKVALLGEYRDALKKDLFINRSARALAECREYIYTNSGIEHSKSVDSQDPSGARMNHGDIVIADALCYKLLNSSVIMRKEEKKVHPDSIIGRRIMINNRKRKEGYW